MRNRYLPERLSDLHRANGLYLAFSISPVPAKLSTSSVRITDQHTKIGYAGQGFAKRANEYRTMLNNRLEFWPIIELPTYQLRKMEKLVMEAMYARYEGAMLRKSGEWFETTDRQAVKELILDVVTNRQIDDANAQLSQTMRVLQSNSGGAVPGGPEILEAFPYIYGPQAGDAGELSQGR